MKTGNHTSQRYQRVSDQIGILVAETDLDLAGLASENPRNFFPILALVTLFQYAEGYTDRQAAEAVVSRTDWKEALRLPASYPGFDPAWLCRLREFAFESAAGMSILQNLVDRLGAAGLFLSDIKPASQAMEILISICWFNRLAHLTGAMLLSIETLAAVGTSHSSSGSLHHLYESYARTYRTLPEIRTSEEAVRLASKTGYDIATLLGWIDGACEETAGELPEIGALREIWESQYNHPRGMGPEAGPPVWRPVDCSHCDLGAGSYLQPRCPQVERPYVHATGGPL